MNRYRNLSSTARTIFWIVIALMIVVGVIAFFASPLGRLVALACCGGLIVLVVIGIISENGMSRR